MKAMHNHAPWLELLLTIQFHTQHVHSSHNRALKPVRLGGHPTYTSMASAVMARPCSQPDGGLVPQVSVPPAATAPPQQQGFIKNTKGTSLSGKEKATMRIKKIYERKKSPWQRQTYNKSSGSITYKISVKVKKQK